MIRLVLIKTESHRERAKDLGKRNIHSMVRKPVSVIPNYFFLSRYNDLVSRYNDLVSRYNDFSL